jgi:hypothetical protein
MDCEKFDLCVMDALYDELDELTSAALRRHAEGCSRCSGVFNGLRATREVGILPIVDPPADLEDRILEAAFTAQKRTPLRRKVLRGLAWAGSHAMRPQLAMAALFFLVIGSSLLLLKARPGGGPLRVTERGAPGPEEPIAAEAQPAAAPAAAEASAAPGDVQQKVKPTEEEKLAKEKDKDKSGDAKAALVEARATRDHSGCAAAVGKFDDVGARFPATNAAADAMWEEATCYKSLGEAQKQRELLLALKANPQYKERVDAELESGEIASGNSMQQAHAARARPAAAAPALAAPATAQAIAQQSPEAAPPAPAKPAASANTGSAGKAVAAPKKSIDRANGF